MDPHLIGSITALLFIACLVAIVADKLKQPYTIALVLTGLVVALTKITPNIHITHDVTFTLILPPLLFYGAMHMDLERLKRNWRPIAMLAIPGVICSTFLIGFLVHKIIGLAIMPALLFGALITPTDPISVLAILKRVGAPERLRVILEGESLFNDGTGVVVFSIILGIVTGHEDFQFGESVLKFFTVAGGGTVIGAALGYVVYRILKIIDDHLVEVSLTVALAFGTPLIAEAFHLSGIIAVVVAGLVIGNYGKLYSMSDKVRATLDHFWEVINFIINAILFLIIGVELQVVRQDNFSLSVKVFFCAIFVVLISRLIVVYPVVWIKNRMSDQKISWKWAHVLFWGGLKGSLSIALVVGLPQDFAHRSLFLSMAFAVVLFTLVVQGLTMKPLLKRLGVSEES